MEFPDGRQAWAESGPFTALPSVGAPSGPEVVVMWQVLAATLTFSLGHVGQALFAIWAQRLV